MYRPMQVWLAVLLCLGVGITRLCAEKIAIIDAGSSGSRFKLYDIRPGEAHPVRLLYPLDDDQKKQSRGRALSTLPCHRDSLYGFLQALTAAYPGDSTGVYLLATAGMRLQSSDRTDSLYACFRQLPAFNGYYVRDALTLSGAYEGLYAWLAANYAGGMLRLQHEPGGYRLALSRPTFGILEIGGASMQLAFQTSGESPYTLYRPGIGRVYCRSYLGGGVDQQYLHRESTGNSYRFTLAVDTVSSLWTEGQQFWGLGKPIRKVLRGVGMQDSDRSYTARLDAYVRSLDSFADTESNYHPRLNAHYIAWLMRRLQLEGRVVEPEDDPGWTLGAALDLLIYGEAPEPFVPDKGQSAGSGY